MSEEDYGGLRGIKFSAKPGVSIEELEDGKVAIRGVTLLSEGIWVDSNVGTPLKYTAKKFEEFKDNWVDDKLWSMHCGGMPRPITSWIGDIKNPRVKDKSLKGDLIFHLLTDDSRNTFELVKAGVEGKVKPASFSIEHEGTEKYNQSAGHFEAQTFTFHGGAIVDIGASDGTKIMGAPEGSNIRYLRLQKEDKPKAALQGSEEKEEGVENIPLSEEDIEQIKQIFMDLMAENTPEKPAELQEGEPTSASAGDVEAIVEAKVEKMIEPIVEAKVEAAIEPVEAKVEEVKNEVAELAKKSATVKTLSKPQTEVKGRVDIPSVRVERGTVWRE